MEKYPKEGSKSNPLFIPGIYKYVYENQYTVCKELTRLIPVGSIVNYKEWYYFDITIDNSGLLGMRNPLRIATRDGMGSQGHCFISNTDDVFYITDCIVMNEIVNLFIRERRNNLIEEIIQ